MPITPDRHPNDSDQTAVFTPLIYATGEALRIWTTDGFSFYAGTNSTDSLEIDANQDWGVNTAAGATHNYAFAKDKAGNSIFLIENESAHALAEADIWIRSGSNDLRMGVTSAAFVGWAGAAFIEHKGGKEIRFYSPGLLFDVDGVRQTIWTNTGIPLGLGIADPGGMLGIKDATTYLDRDANLNLTLTDANAGTQTLTQLATPQEFFNGSVLESPAFTVTSNGTTITASLERSGGGDLTLLFSTGPYALDTTPAVTVSLTAGTDTVPIQRYVYIPLSTKVLTEGASWPGEEFVPVGTCIVQSATGVQANLPLKVHAWTDHLSNSVKEGHLQHVNSWIRQQPATWVSGVTPSLTISGGGPEAVDFATTAGVALQLHDHTMPAFDTATGSDMYVVNDNSAAYTKIQDLASIVADSTGGSLTGRYYSLIVWGVVSEATGDCKLMINLPDGSYNQQQAAIDDSSKVSVFTIPGAYVGTGFLIARLVLRNQSNSNWTEVQTESLLGQISQVPGGGTTVQNPEFSDAAFQLFNDSDVTKIVTFDLAGLPTATTADIPFDGTANSVWVADGAGAYTAGFAGATVPMTAQKTGDYTLTAADFHVPVSTAAAHTITLFGSPVAGQSCEISDDTGNAGTNNITIQGNGSNIDGASSLSLSVNWDCVTLRYTGTIWKIC